MKYFKFIILILVFWNLPSFALVHVNSFTGTILSYGVFFLIILYFFLNKKEKPLIPFIMLGLLYFMVSVIVDDQNTENFIVTFIKYFIFIIFITRLVKDTTNEEIYLLFLLGSLSILFESIFITVIGGRFSGFYLNPNSAGFICILGYCLSFSISSKILRILGQILFSIAGFVTFSRTFLLIWVIINVVSLLISYKNTYKIIIGVILFSFFLSFADKLDFNTRRIEAFSNILDGKISDEMEEGSRTQTWAGYYDKIIDKPLFGNGYLSFSGKTYGNAYSIQGVHNTFLMIIGEAGIFVFFYSISIYIGFIVQSIKTFNSDPFIFFISFSLLMYMLTSHNYFDNYLVLFISIWLFLKVYDKKKRMN